MHTPQEATGLSREAIGYYKVVAVKKAAIEFFSLQFLF